MTSQHHGFEPRRPCRIELKDVSVRYGTKRAIRDVSFVAPAGRITAVIGPSGSGRSTLLSATNRLTDAVGRCRTGGAVLIDDVDVLQTEVDLGRLRGRIGLVVRRPAPVGVTVRRYLELALREHDVVEAEAVRRRIADALRLTDLSVELRDRLDRPVSELSPAALLLLALSRALVAEPAALLIDEPTLGIDRAGTERIERVLTALAGSMTIILAPHDPAQAKRIADRVVLLWPVDGVGCVMDEADTHEFFAKSRQAETAAFVSGGAG